MDCSSFGYERNDRKERQEGVFRRLLLLQWTGWIGYTSERAGHSEETTSGIDILHSAALFPIESRPSMHHPSHGQDLAGDSA